MGLFDWFKSAARFGDDEQDISTFSVERGESAEVAGLDFQDAVRAHQRWKARLQTSIDGTSEETLDPAMVSRDDQCVLGKWIHGHGASVFGDRLVFAHLRTEHAQFHRIAGEVLSAVQTGNKSEAEGKLHGEFAHSSVHVLGHLANLFLEAKR